MGHAPCNAAAVSGWEQALASAVVLSAVFGVVPLARSRRPGRLAVAWAVATIVFAVVWARHKAPYEGPSILDLGGGSGITVVDLVVPPALAIAAAVLWRRWSGGRS